MEVNTEFLRTVTLVNELQLAKALFPMEATLAGIITLGNEVQLLKAKVPMVVTPEGIFTLVKERQLIKALVPMEITLAGIVTLVNEVQLLKALVPMEVTPAGILKEVSVLPIAYCNNDISVTTPLFFVQEYKLPSSLLLVKRLLPESTTMDVSLVQL
jgi:hypothetical protein